jgi:hypothetical protein
MEEIKRELTERGIPFREDQLGFIEYDRSQAQAVSAVRRDLSNSQSVKYDDPAETAIALQTMKGLGIKAQIEKRPDGDWIRWHPKTADQQRNVEDKINIAIFECAKTSAIKVFGDSNCPSQKTSK